MASPLRPQASKDAVRKLRISEDNNLSPANNAGRQRRTSAWQTAQEQAKKGVTNLGNAVGRWLGVSATDEQAHERMEAYRRRKSGWDVQQQQQRKSERRRVGEASDAVIQQLRSVLQDSDSDDDDEDEIPEPTDKALSRDYTKAMAHYRLLREQELKNAAKPGWFGGMQNTEKDDFSRRSRVEPPKRKHSKLRNETLVARQLQALPTFTPYFIYTITFVQFALAVCFFAYAYSQGEFAPFGLGNKFVTCSGDDCPDSFNGTTITVTKTVEQNFLYGPTSKYLLQFGAKLTGCMRDDTATLVAAANVRDDECGSTWGLPCDDTSATAGFGCCALSSDRKGMTNYSACFAADPAATWFQDKLCDETRDFIVIRPCCGITLDNTCSIMTNLECSYLGGTWQSTSQLCALTMCLGEICQLESGYFPVTADSTLQNQPASANQWVRFILPLFLHAGVIQVFIIIVIQVYAGADIEQQAGFLRVALIYFISGIGGYAVSGIFITTLVTTGADPAVYGLLAVLLVELFQSWQIVNRPWLEFAKLGGLSFVLLIIGTLPYIDNWSHIGGFCFGVVSGVVFLPYVTFGVWDLRRKRILVFICLPLLLLMIILAFVTFYKLQTTSFCSWCTYLNCIPYTSSISCS